jgi:YfiH family protein
MNPFEIFRAYNDLFVAISKKEDGSCRLPPVAHPEVKDRLEGNRQAFLEKCGVSPDDVVSADIVHRDNVHRATGADRGRIIAATDALITDVPGIFLSVTVADCLPVLIFDPKQRAIGLVHAGWRGLANKIIPSTIAAMEQSFGCNPEDLAVAIGPHIGPCHFEVRDDTLRELAAFLPAALRKADDKTFLDLSLIARQEILGAGVREKNMEADDTCTFDHGKEYFSNRHDKPEIIEAMMVVMGMRTKII